MNALIHRSICSTARPAQAQVGHILKLSELSLRKSCRRCVGKTHTFTQQLFASLTTSATMMIFGKTLLAGSAIAHLGANAFVVNSAPMHARLAPTSTRAAALRMSEFNFVACIAVSFVLQSGVFCN
jgi:hypothetical protein